MLCEIQRHFSSLQCSRDNYVGEYIATLKEQIDFLQNEVFLLRKDLSEKNELIKSVFQNYVNPAFNLHNGLANKDYEESKSHNNFTSNSHNEKLNNSKSETTNCTDDVQINNRQSCDHVKLCQPESSNCPSKSHSGNEKETGNKTEFKKLSQKSRKEKRVFILGDSILKHVNGYEITKKLDNCKVYVKSFSGAKIKCMEDYAQPTIRTNPDHIVIHVSTDDLSSKKESAEISSAIVDLAFKLKSGTCQVSGSNLTIRNDQYRKKALEVNQHLKVLCREKNINIIDHGNTITIRHLNGSRLHLSLKGNKIFTEKFTKAVSNILH